MLHKWRELKVWVNLIKYSLRVDLKDNLKKIKLPVKGISYVQKSVIMPLFNIFWVSTIELQNFVYSQQYSQHCWQKKKAIIFISKRKKILKKKNATPKFKFMLNLNLFIRNKTTLSAERPYIRTMHAYSLQGKLTMPV